MRFNISTTTAHTSSVSYTTKPQTKLTKRHIDTHKPLVLPTRAQSPPPYRDICILLQNCCSVTNHPDCINAMQITKMCSTSNKVQTCTTHLSYLHVLQYLPVLVLVVYRRKFFWVCCCSWFKDDWPLALGFGLSGQTRRGWKRQSAAAVPLNSESPFSHSSSASLQDGRLAWRSSPCAGHQRQMSFKWC